MTTPTKNFSPTPSLPTIKRRLENGRLLLAVNTMLLVLVVLLLVVVPTFL